MPKLQQVTACYLCGNDMQPKYAVASPARVLTIVKCRNCGFEQLDPMPSAAELASRYAHRPVAESGTNAYLDLARPDQSTPPALARVYDSMLERALELNSSARTVLDVGFDDGTFLAWAHHRGWKAAGLSPTVAVVDHVAVQIGADVRQGSVEHAGFDGEQFDLVTLRHVLEHVRDPIRGLANLLRLLAPGGLLLVQVPNLTSIGRKFARGDWQSYRPEHLYYFGIRSLRICTGRAGYDVVASTSKGFEPRSWRHGASDRADLRPHMPARRRLTRTARALVARMNLLDTLEVWARPASPENRPIVP